MKTIFDKLLDLLGKLSTANIDFSLLQIREDAVGVLVTVPGQRWEIEIFQDGHVEIEVFTSDGNICDEVKLAELFQEHSD